MGSACSTNGEKRNEHRLLVREPEGKSPPPRRPRGKWVDNIKMDLGGRGWGGVGWIDLAHVREQFVNTAIKVVFCKILGSS
jgi:hypothetical protein